MTALPALTLDYTRWLPPDNVSATLVRSADAPSQAFDSPSVDLNDMNGDGLPDLLATSGSSHRVFLNEGVQSDGRLHWSPGFPVANAPSIDLASTRSVLMDATADGLSDFVFKSNDTRFFCFDNSGALSWFSPDRPLTNTDTWPIWPFDGTTGRASRAIDCDYNRSADVLFTGPSEYRLWMLLPGGQFAAEQRLPPLLCDGKVFRFDLKGTHIADLNGDRLQDLVWIQAARLVYWPNQGRGKFGDPTILPLGRTLTDADIDRAGFNDIDGDSLVDFTVVRPVSAPNSVVYWLNRFARGLDRPREVRGLPSQGAGDALRWADMNGSGSVDIVLSQSASAPGEKVVFVELVPDGKPYLLRRAENGLGVVKSMEYESSVDQMVRAEVDGRPWTSQMPMGITVVARAAEDDGLGNVYDRVVTYRDPFYDAVKQEFRGFQRAEMREVGDASAASKVTGYEYHVGSGADCLKGKPRLEEVTGDGGEVFWRTETTWSHRVLERGEDGKEVCFAFALATQKEILEGGGDGVDVLTEYEYDDFGNITDERRFGVADVSGDEVFMTREFELRPEIWHMELVSRETQTDAAGTRFGEKRFFYDERGNLVRQEAWLDIEDRFLAERREDHDEFGNVIEVLDGEGRRRTMAYDRFVFAYPTEEMVHLEDGATLTQTVAHDLGFGAITNSNDFSGVAMEYVHDALGRLVRTVAPGGAGEDYEYHFGNPVSHVLKRVREDGAGSSYDSFAYSDGYGRPLGTKVESEGGRWRFMDAVRYNARKLATREWLPYFTETPAYEVPDPEAAHRSFEYDAPGRRVRIRQPDGATRATDYLPLAVVEHDENDTSGLGQPTTQRKDGLDRVVAIDERNGEESYLTQYRWNPRGDLLQVRDAQGNVKSFRYDSLRRLIEVNDPNRGVTRYEHDDTGHRTRRVDARGQVTVWTVDHANRIVSENHVASSGSSGDPVDVVFHYDTPAGEIDFGDGTTGTARNVLGRLSWVEDASGAEHFSYDARGNTEWTVKVIRDLDRGLEVAYRTQHRHDLLNREVEVIYPDNDRVVYQHDNASYVTRIDGGASGRTVLESARHAASGQVEEMVLGNGVATSYGYDRRTRLRSLRTVAPGGGELVHQSYTLDPASNVVGITDERPFTTVPAASARRRTATFFYDDLHRLTQVRYGRRGDPAVNRGQLDYAYDALGNLLAKTTPPSGSPGHLADARLDIGVLEYAGGRADRDGRLPGEGPGPHAVTGTAAGVVYRYDDNGNIEAAGDARLHWDFDNRLHRHEKDGVATTYTYDYGDRRVVKRVDHGRHTEEVRYVNRYFEERAGVPVKYVFHDTVRLAKITGMLDPSRDRLQRVPLARGWNTVVAAVESSQTLAEAFGADAMVFEQDGLAFGTLPATATVPFGTPLWVLASEARVAVLRGHYPASVDRVLSTPAGGLVGWPRLEPLVPEVHIGGGARLFVYDSTRGHWLRRDSSLPAFLSDVPRTLGAASVLFAGEALTLDASATERQQVVFYHGDHLGSTAVSTDLDGEVIEELTYYPFGQIRSSHRPAGRSGEGHYEFTGKERDAESGLHFMEARYYGEVSGAFASPDPYYVEIVERARGSDADRKTFQRFLANPQLGNVYAYALRNPLKYVDPDGLDVVFSPVLRKAPGFKKVWGVFKETREGKRLLGSIKRSGHTVYIQASRNGDGVRFSKERTVVSIDLKQIKQNAAKLYPHDKKVSYLSFIGSALQVELGKAVESLEVSRAIDAGHVEYAEGKRNPEVYRVHDDSNDYLGWRKNYGRDYFVARNRAVKSAIRQAFRQDN